MGSPYTVLAEVAAQIRSPLEIVAAEMRKAQQAQFKAIAEAAAGPLKTLADLPVGPFVALEGLPRRAPRSAPKRPCTKDEMRRFILQQMTEAKDEAAKAACRQYVLRNRLLVVD